MTAAPPASRRARRKKPRPRATFASVLGELLLTAGVIVLLFVAWQLWVGDVIIGSQKDADAAEISQRWAAEPAPEPPALTDPDDETSWEVPIPDRPDGTGLLGNMRIPRFGDEYNREIHGGTTRPATLDHGWIGLYDQAKLPGEKGNFSMAAHRTTWGRPFNQLDKLKIGDAIVVETKDGWYTYRFRTLEYVQPDEIEVLADVPQAPELDTDERYITLTACSPLYSLAERIIAYGVFDSFQPRSEGEPDSLAPVDEVASPSL